MRSSDINQERLIKCRNKLMHHKCIPCCHYISNIGWAWWGRPGQMGPLLHIIVPELRLIVSTVQGAPGSYYFSPRVGQITSSHSSVARTNHVAPAHCRAAGKCWSAHSLCHRGSSGGTKMELLSLIRRKKQDAQQCT